MQPAINKRPIEYAVNAVLLANPEKVQRYQSATFREKLAICGFFVGMTFKSLHGKGNLKIIKEVLRQRLD
jgi:Asp-tRNA(Asn)/Glu-tRNA(Gln) amidotransferase B subunit